jgi:predicted 3-demethylubiquinone-9 3-methyltransferase (glyoxalase superfamily)
MSDSQTQSSITPFLWFDSNAEEAVDFYLSIFKNSRRLGEFRNTTTDDPRVVPKGSVLTVLNGGPGHHFTDAISFVVSCDTQDEIDDYWSKLTSGGGSEVACGWLKDKFGLSWQIVPARWPQLINNPKAMQAMMKMKKLDIAELERAAHS